MRELVQAYCVNSHEASQWAAGKHGGNLLFLRELITKILSLWGFSLTFLKLLCERENMRLYIGIGIGRNIGQEHISVSVSAGPISVYPQLSGCLDRMTLIPAEPISISVLVFQSFLWFFLVDQFSTEFTRVLLDARHSLIMMIR